MVTAALVALFLQENHLLTGNYKAVYSIDSVKKGFWLLIIAVDVILAGLF